MSDRDELIVAGPAAQSIAEELPEPVAVAVIDFITAALLDAPRRVGRQLCQVFTGVWAARRGTYRVLYRIDNARSA